MATIKRRLISSFARRWTLVGVTLIATLFLVIVLLCHPTRPEWLRFAPSVKRATETIIRCSGEDLGCFTSYSNTNATITFKGVTRDGCLYRCFKNSFFFAGHLNGRSCICGHSVEDLVTNDRCDPACSAARASNCRALNSVRVFRHNRDCRIGFTDFSPGEDSIGCLWVPRELRGRSQPWVMGELPIGQCILHCEQRGFQMVVPMVVENACICSDSLSLFESLDGLNQKLYQDRGYCKNAVGQWGMHYVYKTFADSECPPKLYAEPSRVPFLLNTKYWNLDDDRVRDLIERTLSIHIPTIHIEQHGTSRLGGRLKKKIVNRTVILPVRSLRTAMVMEYQRLSRSKEEKSRYSLRTKEDIRMFTLDTSRHWLDQFKAGVTMSSRVIVIYEEDILRDPVRELRRIAAFSDDDVLAERGALDKNMMCALLESGRRWTINNKAKEAAESELFLSEHVRENYRSTLRELSNFVDEHGLPHLPLSYYGSL